MSLKQKIIKVSRSVNVAVAAALTAAIFFPALQATVLAGQVQSRSIQISDSTVSATGVTYHVSFEPTVTTDIGGIVIDFCDGSSTPIVGDTTCTYPAGFDMGATPTVSGLTGFSTSTGSWVTTNSLQGGAAAGHTQALLYTNATAQTPTGTSTAITFDITGVVNTSVTGTFYARILTFDTSAHTVSEYTATGATRAASFTDMIDYGGSALSTAAVITVTSKVQEQLSFCVYTTSCGVGTAVTLGNTQGVLSTSGPFVDKNTKYDIQTNAGGDAIVNIKGPTLTSGANTIAAITTNATTSVAGTSQFGLCDYESAGANLDFTGNKYNGNNGGAAGALCSGTTQTAGTGSTGGDNSALFFFDTAAQGTYGDTIGTASAGPTSTGTVAFLGNVSVTQTAGIYTAPLIFIATGTY